MRVHRWAILLAIALLVSSPIQGFCGSKPAKKQAKQKRPEILGFQDIPFGASYDEVKAELKKKYSDLFWEDGKIIKLGDLSKFPDMNAPGYKWSDSDFYKYRYRIGDLPTEVLFNFKDGKFVAFQISGYTFNDNSTSPKMKAMQTIFEMFAKKYGTPSYASDLSFQDVRGAAFYSGGYYIAAAWPRHEATILVGAEVRQEAKGVRIVDFGRVSIDKDDTPTAFFLNQFKRELKKAEKDLNQEMEKARSIEQGAGQF